MYFQSLSLSFIFHTALIIGLVALEMPNKKESEEKTIVEIEYIDIKGPQVVSEAIAPNLDLTNQRPTNYQSREHQRVEKQQVAKSTGKTQNRSRLKPISPDLLPPIDGSSEGTASLKDLVESKDGLSKKQDQIRDKVKQSEIYENLFKKRGVSSIQDRVFEDLKYGNFTALNTNKNQFYSFYERINDQIRIRWTENIEYQIEQLRLGKPNLKFKNKEWLSSLEIILNTEGEIINSYISKSSGVKAWDQAALKAFHKSAPFINPPKEMADSGGEIRLSYMFSLRL